MTVCHPCTPPRPQGVENVYTQHTPALVGLLERLARNKLPEADYPRVDRHNNGLGEQQQPRVGSGAWERGAVGQGMPALMKRVQLGHMQRVSGAVWTGRAACLPGSHMRTTPPSPRPPAPRAQVQRTCLPHCSHPNLPCSSCRSATLCSRRG